MSNDDCAPTGAHKEGIAKASRVVRGGGETRRKTAIALALTFTFALMMLAQPISAMTSMIKAPNNAGDVSVSGVAPDGNQGRKCPGCDYPMKLCLPPSDYKWICHNCGCYVVR